MSTWNERIHQLLNDIGDWVDDDTVSDTTARMWIRGLLSEFYAEDAADNEARRVIAQRDAGPGHPG